jgi:alkanesulfonate monooxygenase SsuD/methylene tetrahydromethanopterin reductase-like flavin-dependent oxidoreductase (luciferase family)
MTPEGMPLLGTTVPVFTPDPGRAVAATRQARALGYAGAFVLDHLWPPGGPRSKPALECWTLLAALAAAAGGPGFRLGTLVTRAGLRPPALLTHMAATIGQAAGEPLIVGVGGGDALSHPENRAYGVPALGPSARADAVERVAGLLRSLPEGAPRPEVWVGGAGARMRAVAGRAADAWNGWETTPEELAAGLAVARRAAGAAGRDPEAVRATWAGRVLVGDDAADARARFAAWSQKGETGADRVIAGDPATVVRALRALRQAGAAWCVLAFVGGDVHAMRARLATAAGMRGGPA